MQPVARQQLLLPTAGLLAGINTCVAIHNPAAMDAGDAAKQFPFCIDNAARVQGRRIAVLGAIPAAATPEGAELSGHKVWT